MTDTQENNQNEMMQHEEGKEGTVGSDFAPMSDGPSVDCEAIDDDDKYLSLYCDDEVMINNLKDTGLMVKRWQKIDKATRKAEMRKIAVHGAGLFLLGFDQTVPKFWINSMIDAGVIENRETTVSLDEISERNLDMFRLYFNIFEMYKDIFILDDEKDNFKLALGMIEHVEHDSLLIGKMDIETAVEVASSYRCFSTKRKQLKTLLEKEEEECERIRLGRPRNLRKFLGEGADSELTISWVLLYFFKLVHQHVTHYGRFGGLKTSRDFHDLILMAESDFVELRKDADKYFKLKNTEKAIELYTKAMKTDFGNPLLYANRSQCYLIQGEFWKAYCDTQRTIFLAPDWFKGYYRCAEACLYLKGRVREAYVMNSLAEKHGVDRYPVSYRKLMQEDIQRQEHRIEGFSKIIPQEAEEPLPQQQDSLTRENSIANNTLVDRDDCEVKKSGETCESSIKELAMCDHGDGHFTEQRPRPRPLPQFEESDMSDDEDDEDDEDEEKWGELLVQGLEAFNQNNLLQASEEYLAALNLWNSSNRLKDCVSSDTIFSVQYAFGITAVSQTENKMRMQKGLEMLQSMYQCEIYCSYPIVLYGLATALIALYRFTEALEVIQMDNDQCVEGWREMCWPKSDQVIEESKKDMFLVGMKRLKLSCHYQPLSDAVCSVHSDSDDDKRIFFHSPKYVGLVTVRCHARCRLTFHINCWKMYKARTYAEKTSEKDMMDKTCPTPDCRSTISYIMVDKVGRTLAEFQSDQRPERQPAIVVRMRPCQRTVARRQERKKMRRQKKEEERMKKSQPQSPPSPSASCLAEAEPCGGGSALDDGHDDLTSDQQHDAAADAQAASLNSVSMVEMTKKGEEDLQMKYNSFQKPARKKKKEKKEKAPAARSMEVNFFSDLTDRQVQSMYDLDADEGGLPTYNMQLLAPGPGPLVSVRPVAPHLTQPVPPLSQLMTTSFSQIAAGKADITSLHHHSQHSDGQVLLLHLCEILNDVGPIRCTDLENMESYLTLSEEFIHIFKQHGGLLQYCRSKKEFAVVGDFVGVAKDREQVERADELYWANLSSSGLWSTRDTDARGMSTFAHKPDLLARDKSSAFATDTMMPSSDHGRLNPAAPEFQPAEPKLKHSGLNEKVDVVMDQFQGLWKQHGGKRLDSLDDFTIPYHVDMGHLSYSADTGVDVLDIDEGDTDSVGGENQEDPNLKSLAHDEFGRRGSSQSEVSLASSDIYLNNIFRTGSPASSTSSYRPTSSCRDQGSPLSARDATASPSHSSLVCSFESPVNSATGGFAGSVEHFTVAQGVHQPSVNQAFGVMSDPGVKPARNVASSPKPCDVSVVDTVSGSRDNSRPVPPTSGALVPPKPLKPLLFKTSKTSRLGSRIGVPVSSDSSSVTHKPNGSEQTSAEVPPRNNSPFKDSSDLKFYPDNVSTYKPSASSTSTCIGLVSDSQSFINSIFSTSTQSVLTHSLSPRAKEWQPSGVVHGRTALLASSTGVGPQSWTQAVQAKQSLWSPTSTAACGGDASALSSRVIDSFGHVSSLLGLGSISSSTWSGSAHSDKTWAPATPSFTPVDGQTSGGSNDRSFPSIHSHDSLSLERSEWSLNDGRGPTPSHLEDWQLSSGGAGGRMVDVEVQTTSDRSNAEVNTDLNIHDLDFLEDQHRNTNTIVMEARHSVIQLQQQVLASQVEGHQARQQVHDLQQNLNSTVQQLKNVEDENARLKKEHSEREEASHIEVKTTQDRSALDSLAWRAEIERMREICNNAEKIATAERERAVQAELKVIKEQKEMFKLLLVTRMREVSNEQRELREHVQSLQASGQHILDQQVTEVTKFFNHLLENLRQTVNSVREQLEAQEGQVRAGKHLSQLTQVCVQFPSPPLPKCLKKEPNGKYTFVPSSDGSPTSAGGGVPTVDVIREPVPEWTSVGVAPPGFSHPSQPAPLRPLFKSKLTSKRTAQAFPPAPGSTPGLGSASTDFPPLAPAPLRPLKGFGRSQQSTVAPTLAQVTAASMPSTLRFEQRRTPSPASNASVPKPKPLTSFERLLFALEESFGSLDRNLMGTCVAELRRAHGGSLSGFDLSYLVHCVSQMLIARGFQPRTTSSLSTDSTGSANRHGNKSLRSVQYTPPPPGINPSLNVDVLDPITGSDPYEEEQDPCAICTEELSRGAVQTLDCGHRFHDQCIRLWFQQQTTCPQCRTHAPLQDDFPALK